MAANGRSATRLLGRLQCHGPLEAKRRSETRRMALQSFEQRSDGQRIAAQSLRPPLSLRSSPWESGAGASARWSECAQAGVPSHENVLCAAVDVASDLGLVSLPDLEHLELVVDLPYPS